MTSILQKKKKKSENSRYIFTNDEETFVLRGVKH